jgi:hypothetical protein
MIFGTAVVTVALIVGAKLFRCIRYKDCPVSVCKAESAAHEVEEHTAEVIEV